MNKSNIIKKGKEVLNIEASAIRNLSKGLDQAFFRCDGLSTMASII